MGWGKIRKKLKSAASSLAKVAVSAVVPGGRVLVMAHQARMNMRREASAVKDVERANNEAAVAEAKRISDEAQAAAAAEALRISNEQEAQRLQAEADRARNAEAQALAERQIAEAKAANVAAAERLATQRAQQEAARRKEEIERNNRLEEAKAQVQSAREKIENDTRILAAEALAAATNSKPVRQLGFSTGSVQLLPATVPVANELVLSPSNQQASQNPLIVADGTRVQPQTMGAQTGHLLADSEIVASLSSSFPLTAQVVQAMLETGAHVYFNYDQSIEVVL